MNTITRILITGAGGQIGENIIDYFADKSAYQIVATDLRQTNYTRVEANETLNVLDKEKLAKLVDKHQINQIYHLAALLSANGEKNPLFAWQINMDGLLNILELAREKNLKVFWPSSIAIFGATTPKQLTPQKTITEPSTAYGISKIAGELWCDYYHKHFGVDVRSVRFPGLISWKGEPGGGTTDYAVDIFHKALLEGRYTSFLSQDTYLPMMYMPDAIKAIHQLMDVPAEKIQHRDSYNISGMSFSPKEIAAEIKKHIPEFEIDYAPDFRQEIADSWPASIEDIDARQHWNWQPDYNLARMTADIFENLKK